MTTATLSNFRRFVTADRFVSIRDIQKSPTQTLQWIKIVMNGSKPKGIYMDMNEREDYLEDIEMIQSSSYKKAIAESRKSWTPIPADQVW